MTSLFTALLEDLSRIHTGAWSDRISQDRFRDEPDWGSHERHRYTAIQRSVLENWIRQAWVLDRRLKKLPRPKLYCALHLGLDELERGRGLRPLLGELLESMGRLSRPERSLVHGVLAALHRSNQALAPLFECDDKKSQALALSIPTWLLNLLHGLQPEQKLDTAGLSRLLEHWREKALWLRVNQSRWSPVEAIDWLHKKGCRAETAPEDSAFLHIQGLPAGGLGSLDALEDGRLHVQDLSTSGALQLMDCKPQMQVLDMCAAPGNKSLALLERYPEIHLTALEAHAGRSRNLARRLPQGTRVLERDALTFDEPECFDRILLDAPCGGSGTIGRRPEMMLKKDPVQANVLDLQAALLDKAAQLLKTKGRIVYSTCSMDRRENQEQIVAFLTRNPDFQLLKNAVPATSRDTSGGWPWFPFEITGRTGSRPGSNGAWACALERSE